MSRFSWGATSCKSTWGEHERDRGLSTESPFELDPVAVAAVAGLDEKNGDDIVVLDVGDVFAIAGSFVIASGNNPRLVKALVDEVERRVHLDTEEKPLRIEGAGEWEWVLLDYGEVVVHVFLDTVREFYSLERLWADVPAWRPDLSKVAEVASTDPDA